HRHVPGETEVAAVDRERRRSTQVLATLTVDTDAQQLDVEADGARGRSDREIAGRRVPALALGEDRVALEGDARESLSVEEVRRTKMRVALWIACVDPLQISVDLEARLLRRARVELQPTAELAESATNRAHHHVLDGEVHLRVRRVDVPVHVYPLFALWRTSCCHNQLVACAIYSSAETSFDGSRSARVGGLRQGLRGDVACPRTRRRHARRPTARRALPARPDRAWPGDRRPPDGPRRSLAPHEERHHARPGPARARRPR